MAHNNSLCNLPTLSTKSSSFLWIQGRDHVVRQSLQTSSQGSLRAVTSVTTGLLGVSRAHAPDASTSTHHFANNNNMSVARPLSYCLISWRRALISPQQGQQVPRRTETAASPPSQPQTELYTHASRERRMYRAASRIHNESARDMGWLEKLKKYVKNQRYQNIF